ncbi:MAG: sigma-70 family RNA polymerase sigma factor [Bacteroidales bacterium]|nr:sigma-70 family RNA polymerase sigma factor [Bacteroidales bacterium]
MDKYTIQDFISDLKKDSRKLFEFIYSTYYPSVRALVIKFKGSEQDAKDVFQDAVMVIIRNLNEKKLKPSDTMFRTYLLAICRHIWYNQLRLPEEDTLNEADLAEDYRFDEEMMQSVDESIEKQIFQKNFKKLDETCQKILKYHLKKMPDKKIARKVKINDVNYLKKRKHLCKEKLIKMIKEDPKYKLYLKDKNI